MQDASWLFHHPGQSQQVGNVHFNLCPGQNSSVLQTAGTHPTALLSPLGKSTGRFLPHFPWSHSSDPPVHFHTPAGAAEEISLAGRALVNQRLAFHSGLALSGARQFAQLRAKQLITTALLGSSWNPGTFHAAAGKRAQYREGWKNPNWYSADIY